MLIFKCLGAPGRGEQRQCEWVGRLQWSCGLGSVLERQIELGEGLKKHRPETRAFTFNFTDEHPTASGNMFLNLLSLCPRKHFYT